MIVELVGGPCCGLKAEVDASREMHVMPWRGKYDQVYTIVRALYKTPAGRVEEREPVLLHDGFIPPLRT